MAGPKEESIEDLMREAMGQPPKKKVQTEKSGPAMTFLQYQEQAAMYHNYPDNVIPSLAITAATGRLALYAALMKTRNLSDAEKETLAKDMGQVLYYLSSLCDHFPISLEKIAEISIDQADKNQKKRLGHGK